MDPQQHMHDASVILDSYLSGGRGVTTRDVKAAIGRLKAVLEGIDKGRTPNAGRLASGIREQIDLAEKKINERSGQ